MSNLDTLNIWNSIWNRVSTIIGGSFNVDSPLGSGPVVIDRALTVYVSATGKDTNPGTLDRPFLTIQKAIDYLKPFDIQAAVTVQVGAGDFAPFTVEGLRVTDGGSLTIKGTTSVEYAGTITTNAVSNVHLVVTDSGASFATDAHVGKILKAVTPNAATEPYRVVLENAATTLNTTGNITVAANGTQYQILTLNTTVTVSSGIGGAAMIGQNLGGSSILNGGVSNLTGYRIILENLELRSTTSQGRALMTANADVGVNGCRLICVGATGGLPTVLNSSNVLFVGTYFESAVNNGTGVVSAFGNNAMARITSLKYSYCRKITSQTGVWLSVSGGVNVSGSAFEGAAGAISFGRQSSLNTSLTFWAKNTTTIIAAAGAFTATIEAVGTNTTAVSCTDGGFASLFGNTVLTAATAISCTRGGRCIFPSTGTIASTVADISVDGVTSTLANMRAASPKIFPTTPNVYGSYVYE